MRNYVIVYWFTSRVVQLVKMGKSSTLNLIFGIKIYKQPE